MSTFTEFTTKRHRTLIAFSIAVTLFVTLIATGSRPIVAHLQAPTKDAAFDATESDHLFTLESGVSGLLMQGSEMSKAEDGSLMLINGSALLRSSRLLVLTLGTWEVYTFGGTLSVVRDDASATVAALDAPALIIEGEQSHFLAPGYQLLQKKGTSLQGLPIKLPEVWLADQEALRATLPSADIDVASFWEKDSDLRGFLSTFPLTKEQVPTLLADTASTSSSVHVKQALPALFGLYDLAVLSDKDIQEMMAIAHALHPRLPQLLSVRFAALSQQEDINNSLMAVFPKNKALGASFLLALPIVAMGGHTPASHIWTRLWEQRMQLSLAAGETGSFLPIASVINTRIPTLEENGFPRSAQTWKTALFEISSFAAPLLSSDDRRTLMTLLHPPFSRPLEEVSSPSSSSTPEIDSRTLKAMARDMLEEAGVLFTADTHVTILSTPGLVQVEGVFLPTSQGDKAAMFILNVENGIASDITIDDMLLPNAVPLSTLVLP